MIDLKEVIPDLLGWPPSICGIGVGCLQERGLNLLSIYVCVYVWIYVPAGLAHGVGTGVGTGVGVEQRV